MSECAPDLLALARQAAEDAMIKIEMVGGMPVWEAMPGPKHQRLVVAIFNSVTRTTNLEDDCGCHPLTDVGVRFPDGSFTRPDIAVFNHAPNEDEPIVDILPEAVVEILSKGYEAKDLEIGLPFYLAQGVKDVVIYDPWKLTILHARAGSTKQRNPPTQIL